MMQSLIRDFASLTQSIPDLIKNGDTAFGEEKYDDALNHYLAALKKERRSPVNTASIQSAALLHKIGIVLAKTGDSFAAMNSFEEALKIRQDKLGPGSEDAAETTAQMTKVLDEIRIQNGVGQRQFVKGDKGVSIEKVSVDVGTNLLEWGDYKEAERILMEFLQVVNENKDLNDAEKLKALSAMAQLYRAQGKYEEAKKMYLEALKTARKMAADSQNPSIKEDISIINCIAGYGEILRKAGDLWQAKALHKKVRNMLLAAKQKHKVDDEDATQEIELHLAVSHTHLGCTVFALKKYDEALSEHQSALEIRLKCLEFTDALVSESFNYCAEALCSMQRGSEALPLSLHAVMVRKNEFGVNHPSYAHAICILSMCYHNLGRSRDGLPLIESCLRICDKSFPPNHANNIPNLLVKGDILLGIGELENALASYHRAQAIHKLNFSAGQKDCQLEECQQKIDAAMAVMIKRGNNLHYQMPSSHSVPRNLSGTINEKQQSQGVGTPVIVITDVGRDIDDAVALVILASLKRMYMINPLAVIVTLDPVKERACLARLLLDSLGLHDVPVGIGTDGGSRAGVELHCFDGVCACQNLFQFEKGSDLMSRFLGGAESKSVKLLCMANLKDVSHIFDTHSELLDKINEIVMMGGAHYSDETQQLIPDEDAYNNHCDVNAARRVYDQCQQLQIPTTTISRHAAYGCPLAASFLDDLAKTHHLLAVEIRNANFKAMNKLWYKANLPSDDPGREKLPPRCDKDWFLKHFQVSEGAASWQESYMLHLYDAMTLLHCVEAYREIHFRPKCYNVGGTVHRVSGVLQDGVECSGVADKDNLLTEIRMLLRQGFKSAMEPAFEVRRSNNVAIINDHLNMDEKIDLDHIDEEEGEVEPG